MQFVELVRWMRRIYSRTHNADLNWRRIGAKNEKWTKKENWFHLYVFGVSIFGQFLHAQWYVKMEMIFNFWHANLTALNTHTLISMYWLNHKLTILHQFHRLLLPVCYIIFHGFSSDGSRIGSNLGKSI